MTMKSPQDLGNLVEQTVEILKADVDRNLDQLEGRDVFWARGFVRAVFAYIEGLISTLRLKALLTNVAVQANLAKEPIELTKGGGFATLVPDVARHVEKIQRGAGFTPAETLLLKEWTFRLDDNGEIKYEKAKLSLASHLQFAFGMYAKAGGVKYALPKGEAGWEKLRLSIRIRDRITHPKRASDLNVTQDEAKTVMAAYVWIWECQAELLKLFKEKQASEKPPDTPPSVNSTIPPPPVSSGS